MGRRFPDGELLIYRKWVPQQLGDVIKQGSGDSRPIGFALRVWSTVCIGSPGVVEHVRSNLAPDFPLFHDCSTPNSFPPKLPDLGRELIRQETTPVKWKLYCKSSSGVCDYRTCVIRVEMSPAEGTACCVLAGRAAGRSHEYSLYCWDMHGHSRGHIQHHYCSHFHIIGSSSLTHTVGKLCPEQKLRIQFSPQF